MATIDSVSGPLDTAELGFTLMHEHVVVMSPGVQPNFHVWNRQEELDKATQKLTDVIARGVKTIVDLTPGDWRDIPFVQEVVRRTGMQIIVATGLYYDPPRYFRSRSADHMAELFVKDIQDGIADTRLRAAIIKCATDEEGVTEQVEKVLRAAARAHRTTGVPISTHTHAASETGTKQQEIFEQEGVDLTRVIIGHSGDSTDLGYLTRLIQRGSYIGMDRFGLDMLLPTDERAETIATLCQMGHADKMVLSHDASCYFDWYDATLIRQTAPNWHFNHIPDDVIPALRQAGVTEEHIRAMTIDNPRRIFERQGAY